MQTAIESEPAPSTLEDRIKLLARSRPDDALALIARAFLPELTWHAAKVVKSACEAEEIAADAIECAMREPRIFDPAFRIRTWLYRVVFNRALNALRNRTAREKHLSRHGDELAPPDAYGAHQRVVDQQLETVLRQLRGQLSPAHEEILRLRYEEDLSYDEIANRLGVRIGTVMSRLHRAHGMLRTVVDASGSHETLRSFL